MNNRIDAKKESARLIAALLTIIDQGLMVIDGNGLGTRGTIPDIVCRISLYGDFPELDRLTGMPDNASPAVTIAIESLRVIERVLKLLADPTLDDSATVRALVEYLSGYGFCACKGMTLPKTGGNIEQKNN